MPLPEPIFDSRSYQDLLDEALARIPAHNPEWTNRNDADPGVTLLQLFAFMSESIIYRANLIPERNRQKFLRLLRIPMRAAAPAQGIVTIRNPRGPFQVYTLGKDKELFAGNIPFRTQRGLDVLPVEARIYFKRPIADARKAEIENIYRKLYADIEQQNAVLDFYETAVFEPSSSGVTLTPLDLSRQTRDGALWLALLARPSESVDQARREIKGKVLSLGILPTVDESGSAIYPIGPSNVEDSPTLELHFPNVEDDSRLSDEVDQNIRYEPANMALEHDPLATPGIVKITLPNDEKKLRAWTQSPTFAGVGERPPSLMETDDLERLITWVRIRSPEVDTGQKAASRQLSVKLSWVGINATTVIQQSRVRGEQLPLGNGEPDQIVKLANTPVVAASLDLTVNGELWSRIDHMHAAPGEIVATAAGPVAAEATRGSGTDGSAATSKVYTLDVESGEIRFGDGMHGTRPPMNARIQASYAFGGGSQGMVGIGSINKGPTLESGLKVSNPVPTWGGSQAEAVGDAEKRIPAAIRHRDRLVTHQDCHDITWETPGVDMGRVEILPLFHPGLKRQTSEGVVTVMVIPLTDALNPNAPSPDQLFLQAVCAHLSPRRILTTELHVRGPEYIPIWISISIEVVPGFDPGPVREAVKQAIERFLSPLQGGFVNEGWPLAKVVDALEIAATVTRVDGVAKINQILLGGAEGGAVSEIPMEGLELPHLKKVVVATTGDAPTLDQVRGEAEIQVDANAPRVVPVPVIPTEC